ncbi:MAG: hypothetical protein HY652_11485 [Acidobacteria bacterium]|nr:hypothetical protein [Acidobacteriota bacterium]
MVQKILRGAVVGVAMAGSVWFGGVAGSNSAQKKPVMPGGYSTPDFVVPARFRPTHVPETLLPAARNCVRSWAGISPHDSVLLITDRSVSPVVTRAFEMAVGELSPARFETKTLSTPMAGMRQMYETNWWPADIWEAVGDSTVALSLSFINPDVVRMEDRALAEYLKSRDSRLVRIYSTPELLASEWATFPRDLFTTIAREAVAQVRQGRTITLKDPAGTLLRGHYDPRLVPAFDPSEVVLNFPPQFEVSVRPEMQTSQHDQVWAHSAAMGFFPLIQLRLVGGKIVQWEGGGATGEYYRVLGQSHGGLAVDEIRWGLNPQAFRYTEGSEFSPALYGQLAGSQRAGSSRILFRSPGSERQNVFFDVQIFYPDISIDEEFIVREGYPLVLDSPPVRQVASRYPASLMKVQCTPEVSPLPEPKSPAVTPVKDRAVLLAAVQAYLNAWKGQIKGRGGVLISDPTVPAIVEDAIVEALKEFGTYETVKIESAPAARDALEILVWLNTPGLKADDQARIESAEVVMNLTFLNLAVGYSNSKPAISGRTVVHWIPVPEILASFWNNFPPDMLKAIWEHEFQLARGMRTLSLTDRRGTGLLFSDVKTTAAFSTHQSTVLAAPASAFISIGGESAAGNLHVSRIQSGPVDDMTLEIRNGEVTAIKGGGDTGNYLRQFMEKTGKFRCKELRWYLNPKAFSYLREEFGYSPRAWGDYAGSLRAGVVHVLFAEEKSGFSFESISYFSSLIGFGAEAFNDFITDGALRSLETLAGPANDPKLLQVEWIPAVRTGAK